MLASQQQDSKRLGPLLSLDSDHGAIANFRLGVQSGFKVVRVDVQTRSRDDHIFLTAPKKQITLFVHLCHVAGSKPTFFIRDRSQSAAPITRRNVFASN